MKYLALYMKNLILQHKEFNSYNIAFDFLSIEHSRGIFTSIAIVLIQDSNKILWYNESLGKENIIEMVDDYMNNNIHDPSTFINIIIDKIKKKLINSLKQKSYSNQIKLDCAIVGSAIEIIPLNFFTALLLIDIEYPGALINQTHMQVAKKGEYKWQNEAIYRNIENEWTVNKIILGL